MLGAIAGPSQRQLDDMVLLAHVRAASSASVKKRFKVMPRAAATVLTCLKVASGRSMVRLHTGIFP